MSIFSRIGAVFKTVGNAFRSFGNTIRNTISSVGYRGKHSNASRKSPSNVSRETPTGAKQYTPADKRQGTMGWIETKEQQIRNWETNYRDKMSYGAYKTGVAEIEQAYQSATTLQELAKRYGYDIDLETVAANYMLYPGLMESTNSILESDATYNDEYGFDEWSTEQDRVDAALQNVLGKDAYNGLQG